MKRKSKTLERIEQLEKIDDLRYKFNENALEILNHIENTVTEMGTQSGNYLHILRTLSEEIDCLKSTRSSMLNLLTSIKEDNDITRTECKTAGHMATVSLLIVIVFATSMTLGRLF